MKFLQRLGRSIMLPVAVLPVAAILSGIGYWITSAAGSNLVSAFLSAAGGALLDNMPLLFAVGVAIGMATQVRRYRRPRGPGVVARRHDTAQARDRRSCSPASDDVNEVDPAFLRLQNVFVGIICGLIGAWCYDRFKDTKLPDALSFFSGKRSVAIVTAGFSLVLAIVLFFIWPFVYSGLVGFGEWIVTLGPVGAGIYGFLNRLLIPVGLHHALNSVFWFDVAGINDLNNFLAGEGTYGVTGQYMTGFFPVMMFGLPGAALAMYLTAKTTRKKLAYGILLSGAFASFFVGVTEPLEFAFMFLALRALPPARAVHGHLDGDRRHPAGADGIRLLRRVHRPRARLDEPDGPEPVAHPRDGRVLVLRLLRRLLLLHQAVQPEDPGPRRRRHPRGGHRVRHAP